MRRLTWLLFALLLANAALFWSYHLQFNEALAASDRTVDVAGLRIERVFPEVKFDDPLFLTFAPGDANHVYVVTQPGLIYRLQKRPQSDPPEVFRDLRHGIRSGGEEGLLGLAFDPEYAQNGLFYVYYTPAGSPRRTVLERMQKDSTESRTLLEIAQPYSNHNGGWIGFGPDQMLYVGVGDGGAADDPQNRAQDLSELLGKILRVTRDGKPAPGNPFADRPGARAEVWAYGMRNPWRDSFDRQTGELWAGDVGQNEIEEVDLIVRGGNYGWRLFEGDRPDVNPEKRTPPDFVPPLLTYNHSLGCSVIGGYVYRGHEVPVAAGKYFYTDYCSGRLWMLSRDAQGHASNVEFGKVPRPTSFGEDAQGEMYITSFDGHLYQLRP